MDFFVALFLSSWDEHLPGQDKWPPTRVMFNLVAKAGGV
jgi:hypothetical protein